VDDAATPRRKHRLDDRRAILPNKRSVAGVGCGEIRRIGNVGVYSCRTLPALSLKKGNVGYVSYRATDIQTADHKEVRMAIVGVLVNALKGTVINTSWTYHLTHTFAPSSIWGQSVLQYIGETDDESSTSTYVSQFKDASGTHNVNFVAVFADNCTSVTYDLFVKDAAARAACVTSFFG
jgi:hypothetical protein